jgi:hypothetical protein
MQVGSIGNRVANVNPDSKQNSSIWRLVLIIYRHLLLHLDGASHSAIDAVEDDEQGVAASLHDSTAVLADGRVYQVPTQSPQPRQSFRVI